MAWQMLPGGAPMHNRFLIKPFIFPLLVAGLVAAMTVTKAETEVSGYVNDPFTRPGIITPYTLPEAWPVHLDRNPQDRSPENADTRLVVLGTGMPMPNPYRSGPAYAVVAGNQPYLVDAGEGIWRALAKAALIHGDDINVALAPEKLNYLFVTHLHEDHTVGIPSLILNPLQVEHTGAQGHLWARRHRRDGRAYPCRVEDRYRR